MVKFGMRCHRSKLGLFLFIFSLYRLSINFIFRSYLLSFMSGTGFTESTHETGKSYTQGGAIGLERATAGHMNGIFSHLLTLYAIDFHNHINR